MMYKTRDAMINGSEYKVIEMINGSRVWVKAWPKSGFGVVANILDQPDLVAWPFTERVSHVEFVQNNQKDTVPATYAGSVLIYGTATVMKQIDAVVPIFPISTANGSDPLECYANRNLTHGSIFTIITTVPTWIGFATTQGSITVFGGQILQQN